MRRILLVALCVLAVAHGQSRGSRRFTPSPFLEGQDLGFLPSRATSSSWPGSGRSATQPRPAGRPAGRPGVTRRRLTTPAPALGANDIDDGFGTVSVAKEGTRRAPAAALVTARPQRQRQPQRTLTAVRRRRPTRVQAVEVTVPEVERKVVETTQTGASPTARPARLRTTSEAGETRTLTLQQQVEVLKKQTRPSGRRFRGRRVKKIRRIIHPGDDDHDDDDTEEEEEEKELVKSEGAAEKPTNLSEAADEATTTTTTTTQSPVVLRRQKKIFRGRGEQRDRVRDSSRRQFASRRRVVTNAPRTTTEAAAADPTTAPTVILSTSSPFEPFPLEENEVDDSETQANANKLVNKEASGVAFTRVTSSAGGESTGDSSSSSSSSSSSASSAAAVTSSSETSASSDNEVESSAAVTNEGSSSDGPNPTQGAVQSRRPVSRGSGRGSVRGSASFARTRGQQGTSRVTVRGRGRGSSSQSVSSSSSVTRDGSSSSSSSRGTSRRQSARRRRPSASAAANAVTQRAPTTAAPSTTYGASIDAGRGAPTKQTFQTNDFTSSNSLESEAPSRGQGSFTFGPTVGTPLPTAPPATAFGGFQPVTTFDSFRFGSGAATRFGVTPRPVTATTFPPTFNPTTPAVSTQFFGNSFGGQGFSQSTPASTTLLSNTIAESDLRPTPAPEPATFFSAGSRGAGSGRPGFGSFSFGSNPASSSDSSGGVSSFNSFAATARPTFRPTTAKTTITTFGFNSPTTVSDDQRFGSQPFTSGSFRPISFSTRHPAPTFNTQTDNNVHISPNGAFSFGTGLTNAPASDGADFGFSGQQTVTPSSAFPTARPFTTFGSGPTTGPARAPAVLTEAARFFGSQPGPTAQTTFFGADSSRGSASTFGRGSPQPTAGFSSGAFSFGTAVTEASTLVHSVVTRPATPATTTTSRPQTFPPATSWPANQTPQQADQTVFSHDQRQGSIRVQHQDSGRTRLNESPRTTQQHNFVQKSLSSPSSSSSFSSQSNSDSGRSASAGRSFSSSSSSNNLNGRVTFEFQQENGVITRSSHLRGFDTRLPSFQENVVISDPVFSSKDIKPGFTCEGKPYGYYADQANDCRIFHICQPVDVSSASTFYTRYSFFCGSETRFDQSKLSCLHDKDAMPCGESANWLFRNDEFGVQEDRSAEDRFQDEVKSV